MAKMSQELVFLHVLVIQDSLIIQAGFVDNIANITLVFKHILIILIKLVFQNVLLELGLLILQVQDLMNV
jgi:hypothetical protein